MVDWLWLIPREGSGSAALVAALATCAWLHINMSSAEWARALDCGPSQSSDVDWTCTVIAYPL